MFDWRKEHYFSFEFNNSIISGSSRKQGFQKLDIANDCNVSLSSWKGRAHMQTKWKAQLFDYSHSPAMLDLFLSFARNGGKCRTWLETSLSSSLSTNNDNRKLARTLFFMIIVIPTSRTCWYHTGSEGKWRLPRPKKKGNLVPRLSLLCLWERGWKRGSCFGGRKDALPVRFLFFTL